MNTQNFSEYSESDVQNRPDLDAHTLMGIAQARPDLRAAVRHHPNCYEGLAQWIDAQAAATQQAGSGQQANRQPQQAQDSGQFGQQQYQQGQQQGQFAQQGYGSYGQQGQNPSQQYGQPGGPGWGGQPGVQQQAAASFSAAKASGDWKVWIPLSQTVFAIIGFIAMLLPVAQASGLGISANMFQQQDGGVIVSVLLLIGLIAVAVLGVLSFIMPRTKLPVIGNIVGMVVGTASILLYILMIIGINDQGLGLVTVGAGTILGIIAGALMLIAGVLAQVLKPAFGPAPGAQRGYGRQPGYQAQSQAFGQQGYQSQPSQNYYAGQQDSGQINQPQQQAHTQQPAQSQGGVPADASPAQLAEFAANRPDLWSQIRQHPNCYPALGEWIEKKQAQR